MIRNESVRHRHGNGSHQPLGFKSESVNLVVWRNIPHDAARGKFCYGLPWAKLGPAGAGPARVAILRWLGGQRKNGDLVR